MKKPNILYYLVFIFLLNGLPLFSQGPPPPPPCPVPPCANVPIDSHIVLLMIAGLLFAIVKLYNTRKIPSQS